MELVYPRYLGDLEQIFTGSCRCNEEAEPRNPESRELVDRPWWTRMMGIVRATAKVHHAIKIGTISCKAHMDIKPENIMVERSKDCQGNYTLLLSDFGNAAELMTRDATPDYAPPPPTRHDNSNAASRTAYDIWSLGCVLLQTLVFIAGGERDYEKFYSSRKSHHQTAAFWEGGTKHPKLRQPVVDKLNYLKRTFGPQTKAAVKQISQMLRINAASRPDIEACLWTLTKLPCSPNKELMLCGSDTWDIVYRPSDEQETTTPVDIFVFRDSQRQLDLVEGTVWQESIRVTLRFVEWENGPPISSTTTRETAQFIPQAFFEQDGPTGHRYPCRLRGLHEDGIFYFKCMADYMRFMGLMTYQQIIPRNSEEPSTAGFDFPVESSSAKDIEDRTYEFSRGKLQVWKLLGEADYNKLYGRDAMPSDNSGTQRLPLTEYKVAVWTTEKSTKERVCLVIDIGSEGWGSVSDPAQKRRLIFERKGSKLRRFRNEAYIQGAVLRSPSSTSPSHQQFPGFPIHPRELQRESCMTRFKNIHIVFSDEHGHEGCMFSSPFELGISS